MSFWDLRSDTVTKPSAGMRRAMAEAEVGDDVYGEDPSVRALEERTADLLGKERALFVPSGTMANQIALLLHTRPGDEVIVGERAHCVWYESGAGAAWSGVQFAVAGRGGLFTAEEMRAAIKPRSAYLPNTSLVALENTHNRAGGRIVRLDETRRIAALARERGLALHLDGARLWNASVATDVAMRDYAAPFDTVSVCFSKGLGAPVGSALAGSAELITRAHRYRKMLGGGMRQSGVLAKAALYALDHHVQRLSEDHAAARTVAEIVSRARDARVDVSGVDTNIVNIGLVNERAGEVVELARSRGVLVNAIGPDLLRAVTHLDVSRHAEAAAHTLAEAIDETTTL
ncbi:MAG TPA: low-specificity L-threonine aldolase [Polyangiaceae bacterium]